MNPRIALLLALGLAGCGNQYIPLPEVKDGDPISQLNVDRWQATVNDLIVPSGDGAPRQLPQPVNVNMTGQAL
jgi:hypothetical protein